MQSLFRKLLGRTAARAATRKALVSHRPRLETLEDRLAPAAYPVTSLLDNGGAGTLRAAITQANANPGADTIDFAVTGTITLNGTQLPSITDDLTISGPGAASLTLDAHGASRVLQVNSGATVGLSGLTIVNGSAQNGGGIRNDGTLTLTSSTISRSNSPVSMGGGICNYGTMTLTSSTISGNTALYAGGIGNLGTLSVVSSTISGNRGGYYMQGSGGGIVNSGTLSVTSSTLSGNVGEIQGGGIDNWGGTLTVTNSTFSGNSAWDGAGITNHNFSRVTVTNCTLSGNSATSLVAHAGGIFSLGTLTLNNSIVANNHMPNSLGHDDLVGSYSGGHNLFGAVALGPLQDNGGPTWTMALPAGSPAIDAGDPALGPATDQRLFARDASPDVGAFEAIHLLTVTTLADEDDGTPAPSVGAGTSLREAMAFANKNPGVESITFAPGLAGTLRLAMGQLPALTGDVNITGPGAASLTIDAHSASRVFQINAGVTVGLSGLTLVSGSADRGGAIRNDGTLTLSDSTVWFSQASVDGGLIGNFGTLTLIRSTLSNGSAPYGGAILNTRTLTITGSTLSGNSATSAGGAIESWGTVTVSDSTIDGNRSTGDGGAIRSSGILAVNDSTVNGNSARFGGGIYNNSSTVAVTGSTLSGNSAQRGGGIYSYEGMLTVSDSTVRSNQASIDGGGIGFSGTLTLSHGTFYSNFAPYGGALRNGGSATVTGSFFRDNMAGEGGAVENAGTMAVSGSTFYDNAANDGGAIRNGGTLTLSDSTLAGNSARTNGGGIYNNAGTLAVTSSTLSGNFASNGGGIETSKAALSLNNSIVANSLYGGDLAGGSSGSHNLTGSVALGLLQDNGGPTWTMALPAGSPAIDAGDNALLPAGLTADQRGLPFARVQGGTVDIGAFEVQYTATTIHSSPSPSTYGQVVTFTTKVTSGALPVTGGTVTFTEGSTVLATVPVDASGQASFTIATLSAGSHTITASFSGATGLHSSSGSVAQTVKKATLTVAADTVTRQYGTANLASTVHYTGFVNGDTVAVLSGSPGLSTTATLSSPPGTYGTLVGPGTLAAANYQFRLVNAAFYVVPAVLTTNAPTVRATAGAPFSGTVVTFTTPDTIDGPGSFTATITWGDGSTSAGVLSGSGGAFTVSGTHTYADPVNKTVRVTISHNLGYTTTAHTIASAVVTSLGVGVQPGQAASITFWQSSNGQTLINSFNGGSTATALADWLAATFPNTYGAGAGTSNLTGMTNTQLANFYQALFALPAPQVDAEMLATALNVYATTQSLGGSAGTAYGFTVTANGLGAASVKVGADGAAFGVANNTTRNVFELLLAANQRAVNGVLYNGDATLRQQASDQFDALNSAGGL
jgi:hypothetical protein